MIYSPRMTILHHVQNGSLTRAGNTRLAQQNAYSQLHYAQKNFPPTYRAAYRGALLLRYGLRSVAGGDATQRAAARVAADVVLGREGPPFDEPPAQVARDPSMKARLVRMLRGPRDAAGRPEPAARRRRRVGAHLAGHVRRSARA